MGQKRRIEHRGQFHTVEEWAEITGLTTSAIESRLKKGWTVREALDTPPLRRGKGRIDAPTNDFCKGCYYWRLLHGGSGSAYHIRYCAYILVTGHRRPCPAAHCAEYKPTHPGQKGRK